MMRFSDDDFQRVSSHGSHAKWINALLSALPTDVARNVLLCRPEKAQDIENQLVPVCQKLSLYAIQKGELLPSTTEEFEELKYVKHTVESVEKTKDWLRNVEIPSHTQMILSYDFKTAFMVPWITFLSYYDEFCSRGLDDICICSVCGRWNLLYYHEDVFIFSKLK